MSEAEATDELLKKVAALGHDLRYAIVASLSQRPASATELAGEFELPADEMESHLRQLLDAGVLGVEEKQGGDSAERCYFTNDQRIVFDDEDLLDIAPTVRDEMLARAVKRTWGGGLESLRAGLMTRQKGSVVAHLPLRLDGRGWSELSELYREIVERTLQVRKESRLRLQESGEEPLLASASLFLFELPSEG